MEDNLSDKIFECEPLNCNGEPDGIIESVIHIQYIKDFILKIREAIQESDDPDQTIKDLVGEKLI